MTWNLLSTAHGPSFGDPGATPGAFPPAASLAMLAAMRSFFLGLSCVALTVLSACSSDDPSDAMNALTPTPSAGAGTTALTAWVNASIPRRDGMFSIGGQSLTQS